MIPTEVIEMLFDTLDSLTTLCESLTEDEWKTQTECPGWSVQDNISHIIGTERMLQGLPASTHKSPTFDWVKNPIGGFNENEVDERRSKPGSEVLAEFKDLIALRKETLESSGDDYFGREMITPTGPGTMADFLDIRVLDIWVHEQDIRRAIDRPGNNDSPAAAHTIGRLIRTLPIVVGKRAKTPDGESVVIHITEPIRRLVPIGVKNGRAEFLSELPTNPLVMIDMDSDTFVRLANGRCTPAQCADHISIAGDTELGKVIVNNFGMMI